jgi:hypothetical protein
VFGNNIDFWDLEDPPLEDGGSGSGGGGDGGGSGSGGGGGTADAGKQGLRLGNAVTHAGKTAMVPIFGDDDEATSGNVAVDTRKRRLGASKFALDAGEDDYVEVNLSKKERKILKKRSKVKVTVYVDGSSETKKLRVVK